jgi:hypothetical protein
MCSPVTGNGDSRRNAENINKQTNKLAKQMKNGFEEFYFLRGMFEYK